MCCEILLDNLPDVHKDDAVAALAFISNVFGDRMQSLRLFSACCLLHARVVKGRCFQWCSLVGAASDGAAASQFLDSDSGLRTAPCQSILFKTQFHKPKSDCGG